MCDPAAGYAVASAAGLRAETGTSTVRVFMLALGTRGDVALLLMLGRELARRGHGIRFAAHGSFAAEVGRAGLTFVPVGRGSRDDLVDILRRLGRVADMRTRAEAYAHAWLLPQFRAATPRVELECAEADYFVNNLKVAVTRQGGSVLPGAFVTYDPPDDVADLGRYRPRGAGASLLELAALSRRLVDPGGLWGPEFHFTGFWFERDDPAWEPPAGLARYLQANAPPVVLAMGSTMMADAARLRSVFLEALARTGRAGVVVRGWSDRPIGPPGGGGILDVDEAPYSWLFPRASCIIHHGGCGSVSHALRAGVSSVILPQISAQSAFASMLAREGLAVGPLDTSALDGARLAGAIDAACGGEMLATARRWREAVATEGGTSEAADRIEAHACSLGLV